MKKTIEEILTSVLERASQFHDTKVSMDFNKESFIFTKMELPLSKDLPGPLCDTISDNLETEHEKKSRCTERKVTIVTLYKSNLYGDVYVCMERNGRLEHLGLDWKLKKELQDAIANYDENSLEPKN